MLAAGLGWMSLNHIGNSSGAAAGAGNSTTDTTVLTGQQLDGVCFNHAVLGTQPCAQLLRQAGCRPYSQTEASCPTPFVRAGVSAEQRAVMACSIDGYDPGACMSDPSIDPNN